MPEQFLHGVEVIEIDTGVRPIRTVTSSIIGLVGTAAQGPVNEPVLITGSRKQAVETFGEPDGVHSIPDALDAIFDQIGATVVAVRVEDGADEGQTLNNIIGGVDKETGNYLGVHALLGAETTVHVTPRIMIAPGFTHQRPLDTDGKPAANPVLNELLGIAKRLRAVIVADGPNTTDAAAIEYRKGLGSARVYVVDPWVKAWDPRSETVRMMPASARVAGLIARSDNTRGFWWSPSNQEIYGILGTARPVDFTLRDVSARANLLNENGVATIIHQEGYRLWGNRSTSADPKWAFLSVRRTADLINDSLLRAHLWAVDRNVTRTYIEDITEGVNGYLRQLIALGAILGGRCWADPDLNTPDQIAQGNVYFNFDFTPPYPAEHITFRSHLVQQYLEELVA
jgi:phage tail sheath protein FI